MTSKAQSASEAKAHNLYIVPRANQWIECEDKDGPLGFRIKVRQYITNAERDDIVAASNEIRKFSAEYLTMSAEERVALDAAGDTPRDREWRFLAPYIVEWNHAAESESGEIEPVPSPADAGPDVFALVTPEQYTWMYDVVIRGYRASGKAGSYKDA